MTALRRTVYHCYRWVGAVRYWTARKFTAAGGMVLSAWVITLLMSFETDLKLTYQVFAVLTFVLLISVLSSCRYRGAGLKVERVLPRFGEVARVVRYRVRVRNEKGTRQKGLVYYDGFADPRPSFEQFAAEWIAEEKRSRSFRFERSLTRRRGAFVLPGAGETELPMLEPGAETELALELTPLKRGRVRFVTGVVARLDPFGLCKAPYQTRLEDTLLVLPKRYPVREFDLPGGARYQAGGVTMAGSIGESEEFMSLRDYRPGDPLRHVHWKSWARLGRPIVKEFEDEFLVRHALVLDTFLGERDPELLEEAVSVAASFAWSIRTQETLLDLMFVGPEAYCFTSGRGVGPVEQLLEVLAGVAACRDKEFSSLANSVSGHAESVSGCICVLLAWDEERRTMIRRLRGVGLPVQVYVICEPEKDADKSSAAGVVFLTLGKIAEGLAKL